ncbi:MAG: DNA polymerase/3'-5' exonuclease PolX, partial [Candidatus Omnitrophica bacterium]|nr:DNA polymerase/3'-5' exonuclease PolX [Candidatus Omnitrophota bacterium]
PPGLVQMLAIPSLGPKTVKSIYDALGIDTVRKLEAAARAGKLRVVEGIKEKTQENIIKGIAILKQGRERVPLSFALGLANEFAVRLNSIKEVDALEVAGSLRRRKDTIKDIDILLVSKKPSVVMNTFVALPLVKQVLAHGETKSSVIAGEHSMQVDVRVVSSENFGSALMYFTGSKEFNITMRQLAITYGCKINEYGVFRVKGKKEQWVAGKTEEDIFSFFDMGYIAPELREDRGEVLAARAHKLPLLIELDDIKGDFHVHSKYSDGTAEISDIAAVAARRGYKYIGICDHSMSLKIAGGLSVRQVHKKIAEIRALNRTSVTRLLAGTEVDIDSRGVLDYPESVLREFDLVVAAIHSGFKQSKAQITRRLVAACKNKAVNIIAHPTGKLWGMREPYDFDLQEVLRAAADNNVAMEINCHPQRIDLNDIAAMRAKKFGVKISLGTDAHTLDQLSSIELGVTTARRAWLTKHDVINSMGYEVLTQWLKKRLKNADEANVSRSG